MLKRQFSVCGLPEMTMKQWLFFVPVACFFAASMTMKGGANLCLYLLFIASLFQLCKPTAWHWRFLFVLSTPLSIAGLQIIFGMPISLHVLDAPSRFFLAGVALFGLSTIPRQWLVKACYSTIIGAFGVMIWGYLSTHNAHYAWGLDMTRGWNGFSNPIPFGSFSVLLGLIAFLLPGPVGSRSVKIVFAIVQVLALMAGLIAGYYSGSRAILLVVIVGVFFCTSYYSRLSIYRVVGVAFLILIISSIFLMLGQNKISERVRDGVHDVSVNEKDKNTSMGLRLLMWKTAADIIIEHPLRGVGKEGYFVEVNERIKHGKASSLIQAAPHPHNELLNFGVEMGLPGLLVGLALYFVPGVFFFKNIMEVDPDKKFAAYAGLLTTVVFFLIGLMDTYFWIVSQTAFYGVLIVVFAAILLSNDQSESVV